MPEGIGRGSATALFKCKPIYDTSSKDLIVVDECSTMEFTSRQFRAFLLVAQHRNFSRAAEALYITPSGLSVLIRELESQLGFRLFDRTTRHVGLTSYGDELLGAVRESLEKVDGAVSRVGRMASEASMSLSIGAPPLTAANVLPEAIKEFRSHRPDIRIQVFDVGGDALTQMVEAGKLDMSLGAFFKPSPRIRLGDMTNPSRMGGKGSFCYAALPFMAIRGLGTVAASISRQSQHIPKTSLPRMRLATHRYLIGAM